MKRAGKYLFNILLVTFFVLAGFVRVYAENGSDTLIPDAVHLYYLEDQYREKLGEVDVADSSYQIDVSGLTGTPTYKVVSGNYLVKVSSDGVIEPAKATWYFQGGVGSLVYSAGAKAQERYSRGTATVRVKCGTYSKDIKVSTSSYANVLADNMMDTVLSEIITDSMSEYQKLEAITKWVAENTDYSGLYQSEVDMMLLRCGDCWASTNTIVEMCRRVGIQAKGRRGNQDPGAASGHRNAFAVCDGKYYVAEAGFNGTHPRHYAVDEEPYGLAVWNHVVYQYDGFDETLVVPETIGGEKITGFGNGSAPVFLNQNVESISLPASITAIGEYAFTNLGGVKSIQVAGNNKNYVVADGVLYTKDKTTLVLASKELTELAIDPKVTKIETCAVCGLTLDELTIPSAVRTIGAGAFSDTTIGTMTIAEGITKINNAAFGGAAIDKVVLPDSVTSLEQGAFHSSDIREVVLPDGITEIPDGAFYSSQIERVKLPESVTSIGSQAFMHCDRLTSLEIPAGVTSIGDQAFMSCFYLEELMVSNTVKSFGTDVFYFCTDLKSIYYDGVKEDWDRITFKTALPEQITVYCQAVRAQGLELETTQLSFEEKLQEYELSAKVLPKNAANQEVIYTSDDSSVIYINGNIATAMSEGTCTITAKTADGGYTATYAVTVSYPKYHLSVEGGVFENSEFAGETEGDFIKGTYIYIQTDKNAENDGVRLEYWENDGAFTYSSGSRNSTSISFKMPDHDVALRAVYSEVKVYLVYGVTSSKADVCVGDTAKLSASVYPAYAYNKTLEWGSNHPDIAVVDETGTVTGLAVGKAQIWVRATDGSKAYSTITINVSGHTWNSGTVLKEAGCESEGEMQYTCTNCGTHKTESIEAAGHSYNDGEVTTAVTCTETGVKTYTCTVCGDKKTEVIEAAGHSYDDGEVTTAATCTEAGVKTYTCTVCGDKRTEAIEAAGHSYDDGEVTTLATCTEAGVKTYTCTVCGAEKTEELPALGHEVVIDDGKEADCESTGLVNGSHCSRCGEILGAQGVIPALGHEYGEGTVIRAATCTETGERTYTCSRCGEIKTEEIPAMGHEYGGGTISRATTCTENGERTYTCKRCKEKKTEELPAPGHDEVIDEAVAPICDYFGYTEGSHCSRCKAVLKERTKLPALGHDYDEGEWSVEPTCTRMGRRVYTCKVCGRKKTESVEPLGHDLIADAGVEAACEEEGLTDGNHCTRCNAVIEAQHVIPALGHQLDQGEYITQPTCTEKGEKLYRCTVCGVTIIKEENALDHDVVMDEAVSTTCDSSGLTKGSHCARCDQILLPQTVIQARGHAYGNGEVTRKPTCVEKGEMTYVCEICGKQKTEEIDLAQHFYDDGVVTRESTCVEKGELTYTCKVCGNKRTEELVLFGAHSYDDGAVTIPPACETPGEMVYTCSGCGDMYTETLPATGHDPVVDEEESATCEHPGKTAGSHCKRCQKMIEAQTEIPPTGHNFDSAITKEPTCEEDGEITYICYRCGKTVTEAVEKLGHNAVTDVGYPATCEYAGLTEGSHCIRCGVVLVKQEELPATGHIYENGEIIMSAACLTAGQCLYKCSHCGLLKREEIPALGHDVVIDPQVEATEEKTGLTEGRHCTRCGAIFTRQEIIPKKGKPDSQTPSEAQEETDGIENDDMAEQDETEDASDDVTTIEGVGTISGDILTDQNGDTYLISEHVTLSEMVKAARIADEDTNGKYKVTKLKKKQGVVTGGTVEYVAAYDGESAKVTIPQTIRIAGEDFTVTSVSKNAFKNAEELTTVVIGKNVTTISANAFSGCTSLKKIQIKSTKLKKIGKNAFKGIDARAVFKVPGSRMKKYKSMLMKAKAPKTARFVKK